MLLIIVFFHDKAAIPEIAIPESAIPEYAIPESAIPENAIPESAIPENAIPENATPESAIPENAIPESAIPESGTSHPLILQTLHERGQGVNYYIYECFTVAFVSPPLFFKPNYTWNSLVW